MKTGQQVLTYTKNFETQLWEFMILNVESKAGDPVNLGPLEIDCGLQCFTVVDNSEKLLKTIDLRKFKVISKF